MTTNPVPQTCESARTQWCPEVTCSADIVQDSSTGLSSAWHQAEALAPLAARWVGPAEPNIPPLLGLALAAVVIVGLAWGACEALR
jgi:hypothetical protein